jgi:hypothetical protein
LNQKRPIEVRNADRALAFGAREPGPKDVCYSALHARWGTERFAATMEYNQAIELCERDLLVACCESIGVWWKESNEGRQTTVR